MLYPSTSTDERKIIFQIFCGRWEQANILDHPNHVFERMEDINWPAFKQKLGVTHIYLLGIWDTRGPVVVGEEGGVDIRSYANRCPSPFAITDFTCVHPLLGTADEFSVLVREIQRAGLRVIVDFVPNHTGLNHPWRKEHPDYYKVNPETAGATAFSGDVIELNYDNPRLCGEMIQVLKHIAASGIDGVRCDMAHLIPVSFWKKAISSIKNLYSRFEFIAEAYSDSVFNLSIQQQLMTAGFNAVYDEPLFRNIKSGISEHAVKHAQFEITQGNRNYWCHYVSNHDDAYPLAPETLFSWQAFISLLPGWHLLYNGSLWGFKGRLAHHTVQLLPSEFSDPHTLPDPVQRWFSWLQTTIPEVSELSKPDQSTIRVCWKNAHASGMCWFDIEKGIVGPLE